MSIEYYKTSLELLVGPAGLILVAIVGALFGSFANVCIYRMPPTEEFPNGRSVSSPPSHCFDCGARVKWYDNVPIFAYLWLQGACRNCKTEFSPRYLLVEAATSMLFVAAFYFVFFIAYSFDSVSSQWIRFSVYALFLWTLVVIAFIDLDHKLILNRVTFKAIPFFILAGIFLLKQDWKIGVIGALVGYGTVRLISDGYKMISGRYGMGYGDGKLLAVVGGLLGWQSVVISLFVGSMFGTVISVILLKLQNKNAEEKKNIGKIEVPFGPYLVIGAIGFLFMEGWFKNHFGILWGVIQ